MAVTASTIELLRRQQDAINAEVALLDRRVAALWQQLRFDLDVDRITRMSAAQQARVRQLLDSTLGRTIQRIAVEVEAKQRVLAETAWAHQEQLVNEQLPANVAWKRPDEKAQAWMKRRTAGHVESQLRPLGEAARTAMYDALDKAVELGANPETTARAAVNLTRQLGEDFDGGLARALNIARTETIDAYRASAELAQDANSDVLAGWIWVAKLSAHTCRSCWAQHGRLHDLSEPGPRDHPSGRCSRMPKTKTWKELGFDGIEESDASDLLDPAKVFDALTPAQQQSVLGAAGYQAWTEGRFPIAQWSKHRDNSQWRDYYTAAPAPAAWPKPVPRAPRPVPGPRVAASKPAAAPQAEQWDQVTTLEQAQAAMQRVLGDRGTVRGFDTPGVSVSKAVSVGRQVEKVLAEFPELQFDLLAERIKNPHVMAQAVYRFGLPRTGEQRMSLQVSLSKLTKGSDATAIMKAQARTGYWSVRGTELPDTMAYIVNHEMGHLVDYTSGNYFVGTKYSRTARAEKIRADAYAREVAKELGIRPGAEFQAWLPTQISTYGRSSIHEAVAEAFADVLTNGEAASETNKRTVAAIAKKLKEKTRANQ